MVEIEFQMRGGKGLDEALKKVVRDLAAVGIHKTPKALKTRRAKMSAGPVDDRNAVELESAALMFELRAGGFGPLNREVYEVFRERAAALQRDAGP